MIGQELPSAKRVLQPPAPLLLHGILLKRKTSPKSLEKSEPPTAAACQSNSMLLLLGLQYAVHDKERLLPRSGNISGIRWKSPGHLPEGSPEHTDKRNVAQNCLRKGDYA